MMRAEFISMPRMTALVLAVLLAAGSLSGCSSMESEAAQMPAGEMQSSAISVQVTYAESVSYTHLNYTPVRVRCADDRRGELLPVRITEAGPEGCTGVFAG